MARDGDQAEMEQPNRANCLQLGFSSGQVEEVEVGEDGGVNLLLNEDGQAHLDKVQEIREMER